MVTCAGVAELADAADSKSAVPCGLEGSSPSSGTRIVPPTVKNDKRSFFRGVKLKGEHLISIAREF